MSLVASILTNAYYTMARYPFHINLGVAWKCQRPNFYSGVSGSFSQMGSSLTHSTPVCLVWRGFGGLNLDQWVLGNGQVSILDQFRCGMEAPEAKLCLWGH